MAGPFMRVLAAVRQRFGCASSVAFCAWLGVTSVGNERGGASKSAALVVPLLMYY